MYSSNLRDGIRLGPGKREARTRIEDVGVMSGGRVRRVAVCALVLSLPGLMSGCHSGAPNGVSTQPDGYFVRGKIEGTNAKTGTVVLSHQAIAGLMPAMTMEYKLVNPSEISELHAGDVITAKMLADKTPDGPTNLRLTDLDVIAQTRQDALPASPYHVPEVGEVVPDFSLLNQSDKKIDLKAFRGKVVAMTFVYTRCPVADFCPRMSRNFAEMNQALAADPKLYAKTHLLTVSFDPTYDTPKVLRSYGGAYTGKYTRETFEHWDFAAPSAAELPKMEQWFDMGVTGGAGAFQHSLATTIVGPDGKVLAFYPTNTWTVDEALKVMKSAAG